MQFRMFIPAAAALAMTASAAFAQSPAPPAAPAAQGQTGPMMHMRHWDKADIEKHVAQMCQDRYARAVGHVAELETRLDLTAKQKPLFDRWKETVLSSVKDRVADCQNFKMPEQPVSIVEMAKMHQKMLEAHLAILKAQMPALEALNASLSDEQQKLFRRDAMHLMMEHHMGMHDGFMHGGFMHGGMHGGFMHHGDADEHDAPPPPQTEQ
ncbi:MAG TPA: Spy/CpxP family protein refolding chaperone [Rhizomicrobium sp.]|nr:Spy/CpxP family protein refolding chaperone [Rhizomicrobium sp.]